MSDDKPKLVSIDSVKPKDTLDDEIKEVLLGQLNSLIEQAESGELKHLITIAEGESTYASWGGVPTNPWKTLYFIERNLAQAYSEYYLEPDYEE